MARFPITNAQYEKFDPAHRRQARAVGGRQASRGLREQPGGGEILPVAEREGGEKIPAADRGRVGICGARDRTGGLSRGASSSMPGISRISPTRARTFAWRDPIDRRRLRGDAPGRQLSRAVRVPLASKTWRATSSSGASTFSRPTRARTATNPRGPTSGAKRIYRGGSWKSRASQSARHGAQLQSAGLLLERRRLPRRLRVRVVARDPRKTKQPARIEDWLFAKLKADCAARSPRND